MTDLPAMAPCPVTKSGRHGLSVITPGEDTGDLTFVCCMCGATRRVPAMGSLWTGSPLDGWPAEEIAKVASQRKD